MIRSVISDLGKVLISFDNSLFYNQIVEHTPFDPQEIISMVDRAAAKQLFADFLDDAIGVGQRTAESQI